MRLEQFIHYGAVRLPLVLFLFLGANADAQDSVRHKLSSFKYELLLGPTSSEITGSYADSQPDAKGYHLRKILLNKGGFSAGIGVTRTIGRRFEIYSRVLWERKGFREAWDSVSQTLRSSPTSTSSHSTTNEHLTFSLAPRVVLGSNVRFTLGAGGYFAMLTSTNTKDEYNFYTAYSHQTFEKFDYGLLFSAACTFSLSRKIDFIVQLVSSRGLAQISTSQDLPPHARNNSISLLIGVEVWKTLLTRLTQNGKSSVLVESGTNVSSAGGGISRLFELPDSF